jgi:hypothetical protein
VPPYQPEVVPLPGDSASFAALVRVVRARFPRLVVCDAEQRRLQSDWVDATDGVVPGRRRVTVFSMTDAHVGIVVEVAWLRQRVDATPYWSTPAGDQDAERELAAAIRAATTGSAPADAINRWP